VKIEVLGVSFSYDSLKALDNVTFTVNPGEVVSLLGPNGSGKTTLLKCICNILKPKVGVVTIDGKNIQVYSRADLAKIVGYVPQIEDSKFPLTVFEWVLLGRKPHMGIAPTEKDIEIVEKTIKELGLEKLAFRKVNELSGGEWRKAVIARALAQQPKVLLLDEPTNHLDLKHQIEVLKLIRNLAYKRKIAVIMATHDINLALRFSDKIVVLNKGKIVFCGFREEIKPAILEKTFEVKIEVVKDSKGEFIVIPKM